MSFIHICKIVEWIVVDEYHVLWRPQQDCSHLFLYSSILFSCSSHLVSIKAAISSPFVAVVSSPCLHGDMQLPRHGGEGDLLILLSIFPSSLQFSLLQQIHINISSNHSILNSNFQPCFSLASTSACSYHHGKVTWGKTSLRFFDSLET